MPGRKRTEQAADLRLQSQIDEEERFRDLMRRMVRENKTAAVSFIVIVLMILAAGVMGCALYSGKGNAK